MSAPYELVLVARTPQQLTGPTLVEISHLTPTNVSWTDELNRPSSASCGVNLRTLNDDVKTRLANLRASPCELWLYRGTVRRFAGPVQGGQIQGETLTLNAAGLLAYTRRMFITADKTFTAVD